LLLAFIFFQLSDNFGGIQGRIGLLFFITVNIVFSVVNPLLPVFVLDRSIMKKERYASTYRLSMAYLARFISLLPSRLLLYTIFAFIVYYIAGLRTDGFQHFIIFWAVLMDVVLAAITLGLLIAASVPTVQLGQIVGTLVIVTFLLFAGNLANASSVTWILRWIQYRSIIFYTYEALIQNELAGQTFDGASGDSYLEQYNLSQLPIVACAMAVLGLASIFFVAGYVALRTSTKPRIKLAARPAPPPPLGVI
jgi:ABC-type multidrug transport system permease subunit